MTINPISSLSQMFLSAINHNRTSQTSGATPAASTPGDNSQLSPFAQLMGTLQQFQQTDPAKFKQVTGELASDLTAAANAAQNNGNAGEASALNQLAASFTQASQTGQVPSFMQQESTNAGTVGHHHHHHHGGAQSLGQDLNSISQTILNSLDPSSASTSAGSNTN